MTLSFTVYGVPIPQGSMVAFMPKNAKRPIMHAGNANELKKWRNEIAKAASLQLRGGSPAGKKVPLRVTALFIMPQAPSNKDLHCTARKSDLDKLVRALLDGMTSVVFDDDAQVVELHATKEYGAEPRCEVFVEECSVQQEMLRLAPVKPEEEPF